MTEELSIRLPQAHALLTARTRNSPIPSQKALPADREEAYRIQDEVVAELGAIGGWKVGAKSPTLEPICAPIPASGIYSSGVQLQSASWPLRGIEVELALRLGRDIGPSDLPDIWSAFDAIFPAIEVVETRLIDWERASPLAQLADLQSHGALVLGSPQPMPKDGIDLMRLSAQLDLNGDLVTSSTGKNPAEDLQRLLVWLVTHCHARGRALKAGQIITTGSCTGMHFAPARSDIDGAIAGVGRVALSFVAPVGRNDQLGRFAR